MANILLGVTGSVAATRTPQLFAAFERKGHSVRVVATEASLYFFDKAQFGTGIINVDSDEWPGETYRRDNPVLHIELRRWAHVFVIAPLDANSLAKLAVGISDNCLTCVWRAWDVARPAVLAPAMNTLMWEHALTVRHLRQFAEDFTGQSPPPRSTAEEIIKFVNGHSQSIRFVGPITKKLACGDFGVGAMAEVDEIVTVVRDMLAPR